MCNALKALVIILARWLKRELRFVNEILRWAVTTLVGPEKRQARVAKSAGMTIYYFILA
jgi:hypothetical protein